MWITPLRPPLTLSRTRELASMMRFEEDVTRAFREQITKIAGCIPGFRNASDSHSPIFRGKLTARWGEGNHQNIVKRSPPGLSFFETNCQGVSSAPWKAPNRVLTILALLLPAAGKSSLDHRLAPAYSGFVDPAHNPICSICFVAPTP